MLTRPAKIRQNRDPTRPDPRVHPTREQLCEIYLQSMYFLLILQFRREIQIEKDLKNTLSFVHLTFDAAMFAHFREKLIPETNR